MLSKDTTIHERRKENNNNTKVTTKVCKHDETNGISRKCNANKHKKGKHTELDKKVTLNARRKSKKSGWIEREIFAYKNSNNKIIQKMTVQLFILSFQVLSRTIYTMLPCC